jgi:hypothetical protein
MPTDLEIIRASEFIRLGAKDKLDFQSSKAALAQLAFACRKRGVDRALLDLREVPVPDKPLFSPKELAALVGTFREAGFTEQQRLAVLYRSDPHHGARTFAFISTLRGWRVRAFGEFEAAVSWLSQVEEGEGEGGQRVPVKVARRKVEVSLRGRAA